MTTAHIDAVLHQMATTTCAVTNTPNFTTTAATTSTTATNLHKKGDENEGRAGENVQQVSSHTLGLLDAVLDQDVSSTAAAVTATTTTFVTTTTITT